jgi:hypothetical protein
MKMSGIRNQLWKHTKNHQAVSTNTTSTTTTTTTTITATTCFFCVYVCW